MEPVSNPFEQDASDASDAHLVAQGQAGDRQALERLVLRHQPWIHNLAVRMAWDEADARDLTQEILIRMVTGLAGFRGESCFRTWLYRVALNRIFTFRKQRAEEPVVSYEEFARDLEETPDQAMPDDPASRLLIEEAKAMCTMAMLLCLDGRQRVVFILGEVFGVTDRVGAEVLETSPENFRQMLTRARRDLYAFMGGHCGLVNEANACRCARKARGFIAKGYMQADHRRFTEGHRYRVSEVARSRAQELESVTERLHADLFREHPFLDVQGQSQLVKRALESLDVEPPR
jgi:RNA polymerase sigma factor (sigma-70 family)